MDKPDYDRRRDRYQKNRRRNSDSSEDLSASSECQSPPRRRRLKDGRSSSDKITKSSDRRRSRSRSRAKEKTRRRRSSSPEARGKKLTHNPRPKHRKKKIKHSRTSSHSSESSEEELDDRKRRPRSHSDSRRSKEEKRTKRRMSSSNSDSASSAEEMDSGRVTERKPLTKEEKLKQKELMKLNETPEEKRARRLAKKEAKERQRRMKMGWDKDYLGYTNTDNPFGDATLLDTFVWKKKLEHEGLEELSTQDIAKMNMKNLEENRRELEKVKQARLQREHERLQREEELQLLQRTKESDQFAGWSQQEEKFHLQQAKLRSKIRIQDGRAKPIDLLAKYITADEETEAVEMNEPYTYLTGLTIGDLEDLLEDIKVYMDLDDARNLDYWKDMTIVTEDELNKLRKIDPLNKEHVGTRREGINDAVRQDISKVFRGKTSNQLVILQQQIISKIRSGEEGIDIGYWESLLQQLQAYMAKARLRDRHQDLLRKKLFQLKQEQGVESAPLFPIIAQEGSTSQPSPEPNVPNSSKTAETFSVQLEAAADVTVKQEAEQLQGEPLASTSEQLIQEPRVPDTAVKAERDEGSIQIPAEADDDHSSGSEKETAFTEDVDNYYYEEYEAGRYSPKLIKERDLDLGTVIMDAMLDLERLQFKRREISERGKVMSAEDAAFEREARKGMSGEEAQFSVEVPLDDTSYLWQDKYRPRKPRFFNRVHTGFEWNKYNQTHYDFDNPPPKIVQGYKFNIFYPDIIDKSSTPEYFLTPLPENKDFAMLRFRAGPPYEDIAFKVVNREWEYSYKRGFRCQFHNGIFQLWFHFKRYRYRR